MEYWIQASVILLIFLNGKIHLPHVVIAQICEVIQAKYLVWYSENYRF